MTAETKQEREEDLIDVFSIDPDDLTHIGKNRIIKYLLTERSRHEAERRKWMDEMLDIKEKCADECSRHEKELKDIKVELVNRYKERWERDDVPSPFQFIKMAKEAFDKRVFGGKKEV
ncbi:hypothetical protein [Candidatus Magnetobacterium casense]|uniref:Uncharacterized protein n=1 Tax=Candidatus Magnetobacterium casense TaxID=1455061 RepID=A0ABS6RUP8_9BACT|nr:hypothetical protein [Candidatus Magnetobacterium casensis]MBV6340351.1 hypothetical protein [Candidatus Magnetobacterium casensis]